MTTDTSRKILSYIRSNKQARAADLVREIGITQAAIHRQLNKLLRKGEISKAGTPPVVFYIIKEKAIAIDHDIPAKIANFINENYVYVSPGGEFMQGTSGFTRWAKSNGQEKYLMPLVKEYIKVRTEADSFISPAGWIDATNAKECATFEDYGVDKLYYKDFYSIEKFGKTKLGQLVLYAKTSQNTQIIDSIIQQIKPIIENIIKDYSIDTICFIPPSIKRKIQLMTELKNRLKINLPEILLIKAYSGDVIVSQKSLNKLQERIENAGQTIFIDMRKSPEKVKNILIIDDAVGSGATIHESAKKIRELVKPGGKIISVSNPTC